MRRFVALFVFLVSLFSVHAQMEQHTNWQFVAKETAPGEFEVTFSCKIDKGWYLYSQHIGEGGPIPASFNYDANKDISISGKPREIGNATKKFDDIFAMDVITFKGKVDFVHKLNAKPGTTLKGYVEFMTCNEEDGKCVMDEVPFSIVLKGAEMTTGPPAEDTTAIITPATEEERDPALTPAVSEKFDFSIAANNNCSKPKEERRGAWMIFILGFGGGLLALLTPCVFPMVPLTVSFFTKGGKEIGKGIGRAVTYGISIIVIYLVLGLLITGIFGADALNAMSTNMFFNVLFFVVFVFFAFSFFGYYEITLPSSWANTTDAMADKGGTIGIFFMAFTLSLVSFSCTGPIIGTLLVEAATGDGSAIFGRIPTRPLIGMFGFSLALALPFTLFALFPHWLKSLPQSGGWMNTVKVVLGFLELALALKFLSVADMTQNWGVLRIEIFLALWIAIFVGLAAYALGYIRFPHDDKVFKLSKARIFLAGISIIFSIYLATGFSYKPLKLLSGLAPPAHYNFKPKVLQSDDCPAGLDCFKDYDEALAFARTVNKPLLLDFTGYGCVNCRKMEENIWTLPDINQVMREYVLVSLYVDDRKSLPDSAQYLSSATGRERLVRTVGHKWSDFQAEHFKINSQPYYVLISPDEQVLVEPIGYLTDAVAYRKFLDCGLSTYAQLD
jgi:thiol:disulfide interchange protein